MRVPAIHQDLSRGGDSRSVEPPTGTLPVMRRIAIVCTALASLGYGCGRLTHPEVSVAAVTMTEESAAGYVLEFALEARNDNPQPLRLGEVRYSLTLDGRPVFSGVRSAQATLARYSAQRILLPAAVALAPGVSPPEGGVRFGLQGNIAYQAPGAIAQVLFDTAVRRPRAPFREEGELNVTPAPSPAKPADVGG